MTEIGLLGKQTAERVVTAMQRVEQSPLMEGEAAPPDNSDPPFFARITGSTATSWTNRYSYSFEQVEFLLSTHEWTAITNGITGTDNAVNILEGGNPDTGVLASGVDTTSPNYPAGFTMQPIATNAIVVMRPSEDTSGALFFYFQAINTDFGPCQ